ncbi:signal peptidase I [Candidatus Uhrbacteria bacterium]|nr:signal peptidase I [Candidatus Uhrbacteria bacterium]
METELNTPPESPKQRSFIREALAYVGELVRVVVISLAIILPVRYFLVQPFYVKGASMEPNFYDHEYLVIDEISFRFREPKRGEIVVFRYPRDPSQFFIKRVVGLPGETIEIKNEELRIKSDEYREGIGLEETYLDQDMRWYGEHAVTLKEDEYYILGDNRDSSLDSRQFGPISRELIVGRVWLRGWPLDRITRFMAPIYEISSTP